MTAPWLNTVWSTPPPTVGWWSLVDLDVQVPTMTVAAQMLVPALTVGNIILPPVMSASAQMLIPTLTVGNIILPPAMTASAQMLLPTFSIKSVIAPPVMTATAQMLIPTIQVALVVAPPLMTASALMQVPTLAITGVAYDATGAGFTTGSSVSSGSYSHTSSGTNRAVVVYVNQKAAAATFTVTYGGVAVTALPSTTTGNTAAIFALLGQPTGAQTVSVTSNKSGALTANSVSYTGVGSFGTPVSGSGSVSGASMAITSAVGHMVSQAFVDGTGTGVTYTSYNKTQRYNAGSPTVELIGDAAGAATVTFTATSSAAGWAGLGVDLIAA